MIRIIEHKFSNKSYFEVQYLNENGSVSSNEFISLNSTVITDEKNKSIYYMLYDKNRVPISEVFEYLNYTIGSNSPNSKEKALYALKFLYFYLNLFNIELQNMTSNDISNLKYFLKGISPNGLSITLDLESQRSNDTINGYLAVYRGYLKHLGYEDSPLLNTNNRATKIFSSSSDNELSIHGYTSNESVYRLQNMTPKYISISDFKKILKIVRQKFTILEDNYY